MAFRVGNAVQAADYAQRQGARLLGSHANFGELNIPCIEGIGGSLLYLVDRYGERSIYDVDFDFIAGRTARDNAVGLSVIDHLTHNVARGQMDVWAGFYERIAGFRETRYFHIEGRHTGLLSRAMTVPCGKIRIPINESGDDHSQIAEFIRALPWRGASRHRPGHRRHLRHRGRAARQGTWALCRTPDTLLPEGSIPRFPRPGELLETLSQPYLLVHRRVSPPKAVCFNLSPPPWLDLSFSQIILSARATPASL